MEDIVGYIWLVPTVLGPIALGLAIAYGVMRNRERRRGPTAPRPHARDGSGASSTKYILRLGLPVAAALLVIMAIYLVRF